MAKIIAINEDEIVFDDSCKITYTHRQDCCAYNYADFQQLDDLGRNAEYDTSTMEFAYCGNYGFTFGSKNGRKYFIPCYSEQNGCYFSDVDIQWTDKNGLIKIVLECEGELIPI